MHHECTCIFVLTLTNIAKTAIFMKITKKLRKEKKKILRKKAHSTSGMVWGCVNYEILFV